MHPFLFWGGVIAISFALALAFQFRILVGIVLSRAVMAECEPIGAGPARGAVAQAVNAGAGAEGAAREAAPGPTEAEAAAWLAHAHAKPLRQMRLARRAGPVLFVALALWLVAGRVLGAV